MKHPIQTLVAVAFLTLAGVNIASATEAETEMVLKSLEAAGVNEPMLSVEVDGGVATLSGTVQDGILKEKVVQAVRNTAGITSVEDNITTSD